MYLSLDFKIIYANSFAAKGLHAPAEELMNINFQEFCSKKNINIGLFKTKDNVIATGGVHWYRTRCHQELFGGNVIEWSVVRAMNDAGRVNGFMIVFKVILKQKENDLEYLCDQNIDMKDFIGKLPGSVYWMNRDGYYTGCNENVLRILNLNSTSDFSGKSCNEIFSEEKAAEIKISNDSVFHTGKCLYGKDDILSSENVEYLSHKIPFKDLDGKIIGLISISFDDADKKIISEELEEIDSIAEPNKYDEVDAIDISEENFHSEKQIKCLLIEDEPVAQMQFSSVLEDFGCIIDVVSTAQDAYEKLSRHNKEYDIIFMDVGLPDKDGITLSQEVRKNLNIKIPIVITTAHEWDKKVYDEIGVNYVVKKPVMKEKIEKILRKFVLLKV
jgi:CheY-like chemotaxis protein